MGSEIDRMLDRMKLELQSQKIELNKSDWLQPDIYTKCYQFMVLKGREFEFNQLKHIYIDDEQPKHIWGFDVIHGHRKDQTCSMPKGCHLTGFWPTREMSPRFIKIFEARWKPIYNKNGWEIKK